MSTIANIELLMVNLVPETVRSDAIQSFVSQETPIIKITDADGCVGVGYTYTIGTGGSSVIALIQDHLAPFIIGRDADNIERLWEEMLYATHATSVGAITSLALACIDTALWDLKAKKIGSPVYQLLGGHKDAIKTYSTEGGWLQLSTDELVQNAINYEKQGFSGMKIKVGKPSLSEDMERISAIRDVTSPRFEIMVDGNQGFNLSEAIRRAHNFEKYNIAWFEEPIHADDVMAHKKLCSHTSVPIAVGESMYSLSQFKDYLQNDACTIVQADVARVGGITPWMKIAHLAQAFNVEISPHFLMEAHISLVCAVPNAGWLEHIPQLTSLIKTEITIDNGIAHAPKQAGLGIDWDWDAIEKQCTKYEINA